MALGNFCGIFPLVFEVCKPTSASDQWRTLPDHRIREPDSVGRPTGTRMSCSEVIELNACRTSTQRRGFAELTGVVRSGLAKSIARRRVEWASPSSGTLEVDDLRERLGFLTNDFSLEDIASAWNGPQQMARFPAEGTAHVYNTLGNAVVANNNIRPECIHDHVRSMSRPAFSSINRSNANDLPRSEKSVSHRLFAVPHSLDPMQRHRTGKPIVELGMPFPSSPVAALSSPVCRSPKFRSNLAVISGLAKADRASTTAEQFRASASITRRAVMGKFSYLNSGRLVCPDFL